MSLQEPDLTKKGETADISGPEFLSPHLPGFTEF